MKIPIFNFDPNLNFDASATALLLAIEDHTAPWIHEVTCDLLDHTPTPAFVYFGSKSSLDNKAKFLKKLSLSQRFLYGEDEPVFFFYNEDPECKNQVLSKEDLPYAFYLVHTERAAPLKLPINAK